MKRETVSFIVRTYNEADFIGKLIDKLNLQINVRHRFEIIVVDSSTDDTAIIARNKNAIVIDLPKSKFNYASALNLGIEKSTGKLIVIMSAHAIPVNNDWLYRMISHFKNKNIAGVYCRQIPWPDADWRERHRIEETFDVQSICYSNSVATDSMAFSNAASCIRRLVWEKHNFIIQPASEDREWAQWAINNGYSIIYDAEALLYHSHNETARKTAMKVIEIAVNFDILHSRKRNILLTFKNVFGWLYRDIKLIYSVEYCRGKRIINVLESLKCIFWFIFDFYKVRKITLNKVSKSSKF